MVRFLGLKEPNDPNSELVQLRFICLVFGLRPSPAILSLTITEVQLPVTEEAESYAKTLTGKLIKTYNNIIKVLGSIWNTASDTLEFNYYQVG